MFSMLALAAAVAATPPDCAALVASARPTIDHANADWIRALKAADAAALAEAYADDGVFVGPDGKVSAGRQAVQALYAANGKGAARILGGGITTLGTTCSGDGMVYEWGRGDVTVRGADGQAQTRGGAYLTVWKRIRGDWKIVRNLAF